eukprot:TRINITY_DN5476_c0_g1_i1.p1 TRINITY_DN5476_c0_g1~~TRINITY_DN5476_c0_g1_i1.p1  ORF type:complete len:436 (-),score=47.58 TRINITY_DN5476_c0_g1_i1:82-1389(-)
MVTVDIFAEACPDVRNLICSFLFGGNKPSRAKVEDPLPKSLKSTFQCWHSVQLVCKRWKELTDQKIFFGVSNQLPLRRAIHLGSFESVDSLLKKRNVNPWKNKEKIVTEAIKSKRMDILNRILKVPHHKMDDIVYIRLFRSTYSAGIKFVERIWKEYSDLLEVYLLNTCSIVDFEGLIVSLDVCGFLMRTSRKCRKGDKINGVEEFLFQTVCRYDYWELVSKALDDHKYLQTDVEETGSFLATYCLRSPKTFEIIFKNSACAPSCAFYLLDQIPNNSDSLALFFMVMNDDRVHLTRTQKMRLLYNACSRNEDVALKLLEDPTLDPSEMIEHEYPSMWLRTPFLAACYYGKTRVVSTMIRDPRIDPSDHEDSALRAALVSGLVDVIKILLKDKRVGVNLRGEAKKTLEWVVSHGCYNFQEVSQILINDSRFKSYFG